MTRHITFVTPTLHAGGSEKQLSVVADRLREHGFETSVVATHDATGVWGDYLRGRGVQTVDLGVARRSPVLFDDARRSFALARALRDVQPDAVVAFLYRCSIWAMLAAQRANVSVRIAARRDCGFQRAQAPVSTIIETRSHSYTTRFTANSQAVARSVEQQEMICPERITVVHNGVEIPALEQISAEHARTELGIDLKSRVVGMAANFWPHKNQLMLVRAASTVLQHYPDTIFLLAGRPWDYTDTVRAEIARLGLEGSFKIVHDANARDIIPALDIGIMCSESEGLSNTILEYMAYAKPVVATNVGGNPECIADGETGFLVPLDDYKAMSDRLLHLLASNSILQEMGRRGREKAAEEFSWEVSLAGWSHMLGALGLS